MEIKGLKFYWALILSVSFVVSSNTYNETPFEMKRINSMSAVQLADRAKDLNAELCTKDEQGATKPWKTKRNLKQNVFNETIRYDTKSIACTRCSSINI